jgi:PASTA domain
MTDVWTEGEPTPPKRPSWRLLAGAAGAVVVLAAAGATGGWLLASTDKSNQGSGGRTPAPPASHQSPSPSPSPTPSTSPTPSPSTVQTEFPLPDVVGLDFMEARRRLRDLKLGVKVDFDGKGDRRLVDETMPPAGVTVHSGITVKLRVRGDEPTVQVPWLIGKGCADAGREAADLGLEPRYDPEKSGRVVKQDPEPYEKARWNDRIKLVCVGGATPTS